LYYNECHEPQAERVVDKDRSNFCEYFAFGDSSVVEKDQNKERDARNELEALFKK
jgi:hypothetical protein